LDFTVWVSDPAATQEQFPDAIILDNPLEATRDRVSPRTYVVVATQGACDEEALEVFIDTSACYMGLVASEKRVASIFRYLSNKGVEPERLHRVTCPAGLQLGAVTPPEIAFSIMGEILQLTRGSAGKAAPATRPAPATNIAPDITVVDPVCGMTVHISGARYTSEYTGKTFAFCCASCKERFDREPQQYGVGSLG
jgi:xanthine dehydrogenase accessory factor